MLISCPKCNSVYNVSAQRVPAKGKKFKCAECGNIWTVYPEAAPTEKSDNAVVDGFETEVATTDNQNKDTTLSTHQTSVNRDIDLMFSRMSKDTKMLFSSENAVEKMNLRQKVKHYAANYITPYMVIAFLLPLSIALAIVLFIQYRYEITAKIPEIDYIYSHLQYESVYKGKDLTFKDVKIRSIRENTYPKLEVSGRIYNSGKQTVYLLPIKAILTDSEGRKIIEQTLVLQQRKLEPDFSALFWIVLNPQSANAQKLQLTLEKI